MDVTESQLTIALHEAFQCYLAFLTHAQKLRESKLPRQGKGIETTADLSTQQYYQFRIAGIEACLPYTGKIARRVEKWVNDPPEEDYNEGFAVEPDVETFEALPDGQESPYLDFFSGCLVHPLTPFSAGPSNSTEEANAKEVHCQPLGQLEERPKPYVSEADEDEDGEPDIKTRGLLVDILSRTNLGMHPNAPISVQTPEQFYSAPSSVAPSLSQKTPTSSNSANEVENESSEEEEKDEEDEEDESSEESDDEDSESDESQDESDENESKGNTASVTAQMASAFYLQKMRDVSDTEHAKRRPATETKEAAEVDKELAQKKKLAEMWAREDEARLIRKKKYAESVEKEERERQEQMKRDREAALRAQKKQEEWELAAIARETAAMRAEERKRREEAEAKRVAEERKRREDAEAKRIAEEERKSRIEREKRWAEDIKQRAAEERRRRDAEEARRWQRDAAETQRRQRERERFEKTIKVDCIACMEAGERQYMAVLPCRHAYCGDCVKGAFKAAYKSRSAFKCCGIPVSTKNSLIPQYLSSSFIHKYNTLLLELSTPRPKYCSSPTCSRFLPPNLYHMPSITCPKCKTRTCSLCTKSEHAGVCKADKDGIKVEKLAKRKGWKQCPGCSQVVERTEGCLHITCRCGSEWCYACLRDWDMCGSSCGRGARFGEDIDRDRGEGGANGGAARVVPLVATAVLMAMFRER
ncbi:hypothetical protein N431DRAFT_438036 [Stipitochalara longipes BDJ]|nr:hypothetical protein N431DRAFT_438036 [Stipitochalara longipes BDJ]